MKLKITICLLLLCSLCYSATLSINKTYTSTTTIQPFTSISTISGLTLNGSFILNTDTSLVRVILVDNAGNEYLVFESYSMIVNTKSNSIINSSDETALLNNVTPVSFKIILVNANITITTLSANTTVLTSPSNIIENQRLQNIANSNASKVTILNNQINVRCMRWIAGTKNDIAKYSFLQKRGEFGGQDNYNSYGFEYQISGIFATPIYWKCPTLKTDVSPSIVYTYDVRNRHNALTSSSPYYNSNSIHGWLTPTKHQNTPQGCGCCWAFTAVAVTEGVVNLYYNRHIDFDLSEQYILSCSNCGSCSGAKVGCPVDYISKSGVIDEASAPYQASKIACSSINFNNRKELVKTTYADIIGYGYSHSTQIKQAIVKSGPLAASSTSLTHAMTLTGWNDYSDGTVAWILKDSDPIDETGLRLINGSDLGVAYSTTFSSCLTYTESDRICVDMDGDGYYNWGIGTKPTTCPSCAPDIEDQNDADPSIVTTDEYGKTIQFIEIIPNIYNYYSTSTINTEQPFCCDLIIRNNTTLFISSTGKIKMQAGRKITVESGSKLIINGGTVSMANIIINKGAILELNQNGVIELGYNASSLTVNGVFNHNSGDVKIVNPFNAK